VQGQLKETAIINLIDQLAENVYKHLSRCKIKCGHANVHEENVKKLFTNLSKR